MKQTIVIIDDLNNGSNEVIAETRLLIYRLFIYYSREYCKSDKNDIYFKLITKSEYGQNEELLKTLRFEEMDKTERPNMEVYTVDFNNFNEIQGKLNELRDPLTEEGEFLSVLIDVILLETDIPNIREKNYKEYLTSIDLYADCKRNNDRVFCYTAGYTPGLVSYLSYQYNKIIGNNEPPYEQIKVYQRREIDGTLGWNKKIADELIGK